MGGPFCLCSRDLGSHACLYGCWGRVSPLTTISFIGRFSSSLFLCCGWDFFPPDFWRIKICFQNGGRDYCDSSFSFFVYYFGKSPSYSVESLLICHCFSLFCSLWCHFFCFC